MGICLPRLVMQATRYVLTESTVSPDIQCLQPITDAKNGLLQVEGILQ
jgi:hypothetical protein